MNLRPHIHDHVGRILIVDDEPHNRKLLEVMLRSEQWTIGTAASGEEALAIVATQPPDLILLDVMMPGTDGYQVAAKIKGNDETKNIPVIMITALNDHAARLRGLDIGADDFLTKPVDRAELCVRVRNLLDLKAYRDDHDNYTKRLEGEVSSRIADLAESDRVYRSTFDGAPVGIVHVDLQGHWTRVNQRLCDLLGYPCEQLISDATLGIVEPEDAMSEAEAFRQMVAGDIDRLVVDERRYRRRDGSFVSARVNMSIHRDAEGQPQHFILVIEDITERQRLEAQVRQTNKMEAIGQLASGVAHDFNNMLTVILGFAELANEAAEGQQQEKDLGEIIKAAQRAATLTRQLLAFGRQQVLHAAPLDVNDLITEMTGMLSRLIGEDMTLALALAPDLPLAFGDRGQMGQVVMNLIVNARDAMPSGGRVTIATTTLELASTSSDAEAVTTGHYVVLAISDTGTGMTLEVQDRMFEPFYTTKETGKGTGLGLSTTYGIVRQSKGYIRVSSQVGVGTTVTVYLPLHDARTGEPQTEFSEIVSLNGARMAPEVRRAAAG